jgi:hypothetical protein
MIYQNLLQFYFSLKNKLEISLKRKLNQIITSNPRNKAIDAKLRIKFQFKFKHIKLIFSAKAKKSS